MRYSTSTLIAIVISFFTFLGMSLLVTSPKTLKSHAFDTINFSMVEDMKSPDVKTPTKPKEPPPQEKVTQPPAAPAIDVATKTDRPIVNLPTGKVITKDFDLENLTLQIPHSPGTGTSIDGDVIQVFPIQPRYPIKQLNNKVEGWVKVEFTVNEFGKVSNIKILDSQPKRVFNDEVKRALLKSKFEPAMVDGHAISQIAVQTVEFKIQK
jgi:protein TonB